MKHAPVLASLGALFFSASTAAQTLSPYLQPDDTWISLSGTVQAVDRDSFVLDYGQGSVIVEMDDEDRDAAAYQLLEDDNVVVNGLIDEGFFELTTIEASSVYVESISSYFYANGRDAEAQTPYDPVVTVHGPIVQGDTTLQGTITAIRPEEQEFVLNTGVNMLTVKVDNLDYNPLDNEGYLQLDPEDVVTIRGTITSDTFEGRVFEADRIVSVNP